MTVLLYTWWQGPGTGEQPLGADTCSYGHQGVAGQVSKPREDLQLACVLEHITIEHKVHTREHAVWDLLCGQLNTDHLHLPFMSQSLSLMCSSFHLW